MRTPSEEKGTIRNWYDFQQNQLGQYVQGQPLLAAAQGGALNFWNQLTGAGAPSMWGLSPQEERDVSQAQRTIEEQAGTSHTTGAIGRELLNRDQYKLQRAGQIQALQTGGLNQLLGTQQAEVGTFTGLENPILAYLQNLYTGNQQASIAQSQLALQAATANQGKGAGIAGGGISAIGQIAGSVLPLLAASDERLKEKIRDVGATTKEGVPLKTFEYKTRPGVVMLGVLAQDVESKMPSAVRKDPVSGIKFVDAHRFPIFQISATGKAA